MSSNINANNIDGTYPIAGQDNDSQGFRTNFTNTKSNFVSAKAEIEDLQSKVVLKSALTGDSLDNNFAGGLLYGAEVRDFRETRSDLGTTSGDITLNHANGHYYTVITSGSISVDFSGFPSAGKLGRIRLEVTVASAAHTMQLPASVYNTTGINGMDENSLITFTEAGTFIFEFTTEDGGTNVHISDLSRPRNYFHTTQIRLAQRTPANTGSAGDIAGMIAVNGSYVYVCTGTYDGSTVIWKRAAVSAY